MVISGVEICFVIYYLIVCVYMEIVYILHELGNHYINSVILRD